MNKKDNKLEANKKAMKDKAFTQMDNYKRELNNINSEIAKADSILNQINVIKSNDANIKNKSDELVGYLSRAMSDYKTKDNMQFFQSQNVSKLANSLKEIIMASKQKLQVNKTTAEYWYNHWYNVWRSY